MPDPRQLQLEAFRLDRVPSAWEVRFEPPGDGMATGSVGFLAGSLPIEIPVGLFYDTASGTQRQVIQGVRDGLVMRELGAASGRGR